MKLSVRTVTLISPPALSTLVARPFNSNRTPSPSRHFCNSVGDVLILFGKNVSTALYNGDLTAEPPEHLAELEPDIAPAQHNQMLWQFLSSQETHIREIRNRVESFNPRNRGTAAPVSIKIRSAF